MCGITGGWWSAPPLHLERNLQSSLHTLRLRGPNDSDCHYIDTGAGRLALGHTRLSIIDLSDLARQPMASPCGRYRLIFNGEIYNYRELRRELTALGMRFNSRSDTEVLLAAWAHWQAEDCLQRLEGMFAFVVYDCLRRTLSVARDGFGIKPFYYSQRKDRLLFASEMAALLALQHGEAPRANWQRCYDYLAHGDYDNSQDTFIEDVQTLRPGHWFEFNIETPGEIVQRPWWQPDTRQHSQLNFDDAVQAVREEFLRSVELHLRSDVPLGATLSGGVDSSAIVCAIRHLRPDLPLHTFSYIATDHPRSEERWIDRINQHTGAIGHKVAAGAGDLARDLETLIALQGEPFMSTSVYAQFRVYQLAREHGVTVTLEGQGADELLAGYSGFPGERLLSLLEQGRLFDAQRFAYQWSRWPSRRYRQAWQYLAAAALPDTLFHLARRYSGRAPAPPWLNAGILREANVSLRYARSIRQPEARGRRVMESMGHSLQQRFLPGYLREGDRNSMQFSVESRLPFLTLPMARLLLSLPEDYLISHQGETKHVFRAAMRGIIPDDVLDRRDKIGFETPEFDWLSGMAGTVRGWLAHGEQIPFLNHAEILRQFDAMMAG
ncbi:MAG: asparagine synthase (glutamine-hydrolyzing), partial [Alcaligenaceae bacterium]|nr:asparagine synthase (glutamine-hydrolyzing) [Alcaligenaceae bacterium]